VEKVNASLKKLKENGEYDKIYTKWFGQAVK
ncbi:MAG: transporter substrate-binding domain-containing protein, partial [Advenella sp.]